MVHMFTLCASACHNGSVRNGRAVVTANGTCHTGRDGNNHEVVIHTAKSSHHNGDENPESSPGSSRCKSQEGGNHEDNSRHEVHEACGAPANNTSHEFFCPEGIGNALQSPGQGKNEDGGHHGLETCRKTFHALAKTKDPAGHIKYKRQ